LTPLDRVHPVRAYFNDPRISGTTKAFHVGVDISAPNAKTGVRGRSGDRASRTPAPSLSRLATASSARQSGSARSGRRRDQAWARLIATMNLFVRWFR
jgi:hypothetical protein